MASSTLPFITNNDSWSYSCRDPSATLRSSGSISLSGGDSSYTSYGSYSVDASSASFCSTRSGGSYNDESDYQTDNSTYSASPAPGRVSTADHLSIGSIMITQAEPVSSFVTQIKRRFKRTTGATPKHGTRPHYTIQQQMRQQQSLLAPQSEMAIYSAQPMSPNSQEAPIQAQVLWRRFQAKWQPSVTLSEYTKRLIHYAATDEILVISLIYMDRAIINNPGLQITESNAHRLVLASSVVAIKFWCDIFYTNSYYAKVGGVTTDEINELERSLLALLDFQLYITPSTYSQYESLVKPRGVERLAASEPTSFTSQASESCVPSRCSTAVGPQRVEHLSFTLPPLKIDSKNTQTVSPPPSIVKPVAPLRGPVPCRVASETAVCNTFQQQRDAEAAATLVAVPVTLAGRSHSMFPSIQSRTSVPRVAQDDFLQRAGRTLQRQPGQIGFGQQEYRPYFYRTKP